MPEIIVVVHLNGRTDLNPMSILDVIQPGASLDTLIFDWTDEECTQVEHLRLGVKIKVYR